MSITVLNIAAGKFKPLGMDAGTPTFLVNLDTMYYSHTIPDQIELERRQWAETVDKTFYCNKDAFEFMERTQIYFDEICIYRFLEHVSFTQVQYFIYLLSTITEKGAIVDVIVPNYKTLADMLWNDDPFSSNFEADNILLTTELLNEPSCPHASIWTAKRAEYFFQLENRFKLTHVNEKFEFDGRDIYLRFQAVRL